MSNATRYRPGINWKLKEQALAIRKPHICPICDREILPQRAKNHLRC